MKHLLFFTILITCFLNYQCSRCIRGDCTNGEGICVSASGDKYVGEFKNGNKHGTGKLFYKNGNILLGFFHYNKPNGDGIFIWNDGSKFIGIFKNGYFDGFGIYTEPNGYKYEGFFYNGNKHGYGIEFYNDGTKYIGLWQHNYKHGNGIIHLKNNKTINRIYEYDNIVTETDNISMNDKNNYIFDSCIKECVDNKVLNGFEIKNALKYCTKLKDGCSILKDISKFNYDRINYFKINIFSKSDEDIYKDSWNAYVECRKSICPKYISETIINFSK